MSHRRHVLSALLSAAVVSIASNASAACLTNPSSPVGSSYFGATVQSFINIGVNVVNTCIENTLWSPGPGFAFGSYMRGTTTWEAVPDNSNPESGPRIIYPPTPSLANNIDHVWIYSATPNVHLNGIDGGSPSAGLVWDMNGLTNRITVFPFIDHNSSLPGEALETSVWFSNDPDAPDGSWVAGSLVHVYGQGWAANPIVTDDFVSVYQAPGSMLYRYVALTWGGPGAYLRDGDTEIDAIGTDSLQPIPEPSSLLFLSIGLVGAAMTLSSRRKEVGGGTPQSRSP